MRAVQFSIVSFPKLQQDKELLFLRERFFPDLVQPEPYILVVSPWVPVEHKEVVTVVNNISETKRKLSPIAVSCEKWQRQGEFLVAEVTDGQEAVRELRKRISGFEPAQLIEEVAANFYLIGCRVPDEEKWTQILNEAKRIGRSLGVVDSVELIRILPDGSWRNVAYFPFGVGRVDFYEHLVE